MFKEIISGRINGLVNHRVFLVDDETDLASLPTNCAAGSKAHVVNQRKVYILNTQGEWKVYVDYTQGGNTYGIEDEDDAMEMLTDMGIIDPVTDEEGNVFTDESGNILTI